MPVFAAPVTRNPGPPWRLIHVGSIYPVKDQATMLQAMRIAADKLPIHLDWFGVDVLDGKMQSMIAELGLEGDRQLPWFSSHR